MTSSFDHFTITSSEVWFLQRYLPKGGTQFVPPNFTALRWLRMVMMMQQQTSLKKVKPKVPTRQVNKKVFMKIMVFWYVCWGLQKKSDLNTLFHF